MILFASNPTWADPLETSILLDVFLDDDPAVPSKMLVQAQARDVHIVELYNAALSGQYGPIAPFVTPPMVFPNLTARQLRLALLASGITPTMVNDELMKLPSPQREASQIEWEYANLYQRDHPLVTQFGSVFNLTPEQVDQMWLAAIQL